MATAPRKYLDPVDPNLAAIVQGLINQKGPRERSLQDAADQVVEWLAQHGRFIQANGTGDLFYLWRDEHRLFRIDTERWESWLYLLTMINPASPNFRYLKAACRAAAHDGEHVDICRLAHWDGQFLRVSAFDGTVWRLDGQSIDQEANGDGPVIFEDNVLWTPFTPDFSANGQSLTWWLNLPN